MQNSFWEQDINAGPIFGAGQCNCTHWPGYGVQEPSPSPLWSRNRSRRTPMEQCTYIVTSLKGLWGHDSVDGPGWVNRQEATGQCVHGASHRFPPSVTPSTKAMFRYLLAPTPRNYPQDCSTHRMHLPAHRGVSPHWPEAVGVS